MGGAQSTQGAKAIGVVTFENAARVDHGIDAPNPPGSVVNFIDQPKRAHFAAGS